MQKKSIFYGLIFLVALLTGVSCKKYEVQHDGAWTDAQAKTGPDIARSIVYVDNQGLWACTKSGKNRKLLYVNTASGIARVSISPDYSKIAYQQAGKITVIDSTGKVLKNNITANTITHFDWYHDNKMLYGVDYAIDKVVPLYGGVLPIGLPQMVLYGLDSPNFAYITKEDDLLYNNNCYSTSTPYLAYIKKGTTNPQYLDNYTSTWAVSEEFHIANNATTALLMHNFGSRYRFGLEIKNRTIAEITDYDEYALFLYPNGDELRSRLNSGIQFFSEGSNASPCSDYDGCQITDYTIYDAK
jgi:hypothetical protein